MPGIPHVRYVTPLNGAFVGVGLFHCQCHSSIDCFTVTFLPLSRLYKAMDTTRIFIRVKELNYRNDCNFIFLASEWPLSAVRDYAIKL